MKKFARIALITLTLVAISQPVLAAGTKVPPPVQKVNTVSIFDYIAFWNWI